MCNRHDHVVHPGLNRDVTRLMVKPAFSCSLLICVKELTMCKKSCVVVSIDYLCVVYSVWLDIKYIDIIYPFIYKRVMTQKDYHNVFRTYLL